MGRITSSVGLVSGLPIGSLVSSLISLEQQPVTQLTTQNTTLKGQVTSLQQLQAQLTALQAAATALGQSSLFQGRSINSSNTAALTATVNPTATAPPVLGTYQYTPVQVAQTQQFESSPLASDSTPLGAGSLTFQYGGFVNRPVNLDLLNGGAGFSPGSIQITDRSGAAATVNLTAAQNINDVVNAINGTAGIHVQASIVGDHLQLTDTSGGSAHNLQVQEVGGGSTAASLGIGGIDTNSTSSAGSNILSLFSNLPAAELNDGAGVAFDPFLPDVQVQLADGTSVAVTLHPQAVTGTYAQTTIKAANGVNASLKFTALQPGPSSGGVTVSFVDNPSVTAGNETVAYNAQAKTLTFGIQQGATTANDIIAALARSPAASAAFTAQTVAGGNGDGLISPSDIGITAGPQATATTPGTLGANSSLTFTAVNGGPDYNNVQVKFVANGSISAGQETVSYDDSNPASPTLTFQFAAGQSTANGIIAALQNNPTVSQLFTASLSPGSNGTGLVSTSDGVTTSGGSLVNPVSADAPTTLGAILADFNAAAPGKLQANIAPDGQSIQLTDLTTGSGTFSISDINGSQAAQDLGLLASPASSGVIQGRPILGTLNSVLLTSLNGGAGISGLGTLALTNRAGVGSTVDLSGAQTVQDVIDAINTHAVGIQASVNAAGTGIQLTDTTGSTLSNLIVGDADSSHTAEVLGLATNTAANSVNSGSLHLQTVSQSTLLSDYNGGGGVGQGRFQIVSASGQSATIKVTSTTLTVGDLINAINATGLDVTASINSTGDGIQLVDTSGGGGTLKVTSLSGTTAADLHLLGAATTQTVNSQTQQVVNGSGTFTVNISPTDTLQDVVNNINNLNSGVQAAEVNTGSSIYPFRLTLTSGQSGAAGQLAVDSSQAPFTLQQTSAGQDALLYVGTPGHGGFLASSPTDTFNSVLSGATLTVNGATTSPVTLGVAQDSSTLVSEVQAFVSAYNSVNSNLASLTSFSASSSNNSTLLGDPGVLQVQTQLDNLVSGQLTGTGSISSLAALGISILQDGSLSLNSTQLQNELASNPQDVQNFFTTANTGLSAQFQSALTQLAGQNQSTLTEETNALTTQVQNNTNRINLLNQQITADQNRLTQEFDNAEVVISELQTSLASLSAIQGYATIGGQLAGSTSLSNPSSSSSASKTGSNISSGLSGSG